MLNAVLVEDDPLSAQALIDVISDIDSEINILSVISSVKEAHEKLKNQKVDLIFLDIELEDGKGFDLLTQLEEIDFEVIITTSHDSYMLEAIKHSAIDYLMKPINKAEVQEALNRFYKRQEKLDTGNKKEKSKTNRLVIPNQGGLQLVNISDIIRLESDGPYTNLFLANGSKIMTSKNLGFYQKNLEGHDFYRVHHSHIINLECVVNYVKGEGGYVLMTDKSMVAVSRRKKEDFLSAIGAG